MYNVGVKSIDVSNVNGALATAIPYLLAEGEREDSRNGVVLVAPVPVCTVYHNPTQRVLFSPLRDANPFFHLMESLWMLAGRNDLSFPAFFNKRFIEYSDDGALVHGAYGHRWRVLFGMDQLAHLADELKKNPNSRRAVLQMWSALGDLTPVEVQEYNSPKVVRVGGLGSKDVPCNTHVYFDARHGKLNMTVLCRSNDAIWGAYGANAVHFSILQEYIAFMVGVPVGVYRQFSNNFHAYTDVYDLPTLRNLAQQSAQSDYYSEHPLLEGHVETVVPSPLITTTIEAWNKDLRAFMRDPAAATVYNDDFFNKVAAPMFKAYAMRKAKQGNGMEFIEKVEAQDWKLACTQWIARREKGN